MGAGLGSPGLRRLFVPLPLVCGCLTSPTIESATPPAEHTASPSAPVATSHRPPRPEPAAVDAPAEPAELPSELRALLAMGPEASTSLGTPVEGRLDHGVPLPLAGPGFRFNPAKDPAHRYGSVEMVQGIVRAAAQVQERHPGGELVVGDLSQRAGGDIVGHVSHRSGRDVDLLFYLLDAKEEPFPAKAIPIEPDGTGVDYQDLSDAADDIPVHIDLPRTWTLFEALLTDPHNAIGRIFVVEHVRAMLLEHARSSGAPALAISRFSDLACQPGFPHDDHAHLRWFCAVDDIAAGCEDTPPIYPWHRESLAKAGVVVRIAGKPQKPPPPVTSHARAEARARKVSGSFDPAVTQFLQRRKRWIERPHPGRPYCP